MQSADAAFEARAAYAGVRAHACVLHWGGLTFRLWPFLSAPAAPSAAAAAAVAAAPLGTGAVARAAMRASEARPPVGAAPLPSSGPPVLLPPPTACGATHGEHRALYTKFGLSDRRACRACAMTGSERACIRGMPQGMTRMCASEPCLTAQRACIRSMRQGVRHRGHVSGACVAGVACNKVPDDHVAPPRQAMAAADLTPKRSPSLRTCQQAGGALGRPCAAALPAVAASCRRRRCARAACTLAKPGAGACK